MRFPRASSVPLTARLTTSLVVTLHQVRPPLSSVMGGAFARTSEGGRSAALPPSARARTSRGGGRLRQSRHTCRPPGRLGPAAEVAGAPELADPDLSGEAYRHRTGGPPARTGIPASRLPNPPTPLGPLATIASKLRMQQPHAGHGPTARPPSPIRDPHSRQTRPRRDRTSAADMGGDLQGWGQERETNAAPRPTTPGQ